MQPFLIEFLQFLLCNLRCKCPNWTDLERLTARPFTLVWENSDIEWMKVPSTSSTVTKYLTFEVPRYFLWTIKMNCRRSLVHFSTKVMTLMLKQIHSETNIFLSTKVIWEREKRGLISYWSAWGSDRRLCLKILPSRKNEIYLWQMATKVVWGCTRRLTKALPLPVGRDRKMLTG